MVKSNKSAKRTTRSAKQVDEPLVDTESDLPQKERINLTTNNSRAVAETNSDLQNRLKQDDRSPNLSTTGESGLVDQPKDIVMVPKGSPTHRDLSLLVGHWNRLKKMVMIQRANVVHFFSLIRCTRMTLSIHHFQSSNKKN